MMMMVMMMMMMRIVIIVMVLLGTVDGCSHDYDDGKNSDDVNININIKK